MSARYILQDDKAIRTEIGKGRCKALLSECQRFEARIGYVRQGLETGNTNTTAAQVQA